MNQAWGARVVGRTPLLYGGGADETLDRPAHVRAGSALVRWNGSLAVIQDDACFLAVIDPETKSARDMPFGTLPRQFDDLRGNKKKKLDLEAAIAHDGMLIAFGSGSSALRERVVIIRDAIEIIEASDLYRALRVPSFCGTELNIEGALLHGDDVVFFQRGNGLPPAIDATIRVDRAGLFAYLRGEGPMPALRDPIVWDLGHVNGHRLTFTDAAICDDHRIAFLACAEDSPDATRDGPVAAVAIGWLDDSARTVNLGLILDERGEPLLDKAEGLAIEGGKRAWVVTDRDDPTAPSELLEIQLGEAW